MKSLKVIFALLVFLQIVNCSSDSSDFQSIDDEPSNPVSDNDDEPVLVPDPSVAELIFPENNLECYKGEIVDETYSIVTFKWNPSENTDSYDVKVINLNTSSITTRTITSNEIDIPIQRGTPYRWYVISKAENANSSATSEAWQFYNSGPGIENYAPFPATLLYPLNKDVLTSYQKLEWTGNDVDHDILNYEVYIGTSLENLNILTTLSGNEIYLYDLIEIGTTYFWQIKTNDSYGNSSFSEVFSFTFK